MLQHGLRTGLRRCSHASRPVSRTLNTSTPSIPGDKLSLRSDSGTSGIYDDNIHSVPRGQSSTSPRNYDEEPFASSQTRPMPTPTKSSCYPQMKISNGDSAGSSDLRRPIQSASISPKVPLVSTVGVDSLAPHEMTTSYREEYSKSRWIAEGELRDVLKTVLPIPFKRTQYSLPHPATPEELELRLHQALTFRPLPSLSRLVNYHESYPSLHSAPSYNLLVQLAIRHTSYSKALQLLRRMEGMGIKPDTHSKLLYVRLLVRIGRSHHAWAYVRQELACGDEKAALPLLLELLGFLKPTEFCNKALANGASSAPVMSGQSANDGQDVSLLRGWQKRVLAVIPKHLPSGAHPPVHFILTVVRHLLRSSRTETAQAVTLEWISHLPRTLSLPRKRHCLRLLHMHLALSGKNLATHFSNRDFVNTFLQRRPDLRPDSTTLFLLLRSLLRAKGRTTFHALRLVNGFCEKWGSNVIDRRVRRRIVHIATREGRLNVARAWTEAEDRASTSREVMTLQRAVAGEQAIKLPRKIRRMSFQKLMPRVHDENRKWRWMKRRVWRRKRLHVSRQTKACPRDSDNKEKCIVGHSTTGV